MLGFYWTTDKQRSAAQRRLGNVVQRLKLTFIARHILSWALFIGVLIGIGGLAARLNEGANAQNSLAIVVGLLAALMVTLRYGLAPLETLSQRRWRGWLGQSGGQSGTGDTPDESFEQRMVRGRHRAEAEHTAQPARISLKSRLAIAGAELSARAQATAARRPSWRRLRTGALHVSTGRVSSGRVAFWMPWALASLAGLGVLGLIGLSAPKIDDFVTSALAPSPPRIVEDTARVVGPGTVRLGAYIVQLQGISAPDADQRCETTRGQNWACGQAAQRAFRRLAHAKRIACEIPASVTEGPVTARCFRRKKDLAEDLVRLGYASPAGGAGRPYALAESQAKQTRRGLWR